MSEAPFRTAGPDAAFFDLDRTLIAGSSAAVFAVAAWREGLIPGREFARDGAGAVRFQLFGADDHAVDQARERVLRVVAGKRRQDLLDLNEKVLPRLLDKVRPEAKRLLDLHHARGRTTFIVSAAPADLVEPLAQALGMTGGIGTRGIVDGDGVFTGELDGPFCYGPGKVDAIRELADWEGLELGRCYAYSDSHSDLPMLEAVGHPVAVNPDATLARLAQERGWPVVHFHRKTRQVVRRSAAGAATVALAGASFAAGARFGGRDSAAASR